MRAKSRSLRMFLAVAAATVPFTLEAAVIDNVLTQWRGFAGKCEDGLERFHQATMHVAMFEAINAITPKYAPYRGGIKADAGMSAEVAAAQAAHDVLVALCPDQKSVFEGGLKTALESVADESARKAAAKVGQDAAASILESRKDSGAKRRDPVIEPSAPGRYVPTVRRVGFHLATQQPWVLARPDEVRPGPPPALTSATWARDLEEVKAYGQKKSKARSRQQTDSAKFWAPRDTRIVLDQLIGRPGRSLVDDARFLALAEMAHADAYVAMMDGKYHYQFWRPITAIRHADSDGNADTTPDPVWEGIAETPAHPEYPCGHCLSASAIGTVIAREFAEQAPPLVLQMEDALLRRFDTPAEYVQDVSLSRLYFGVHYRFSIDAGITAGDAIGNLAVDRLLLPVRGR